MAPSSLLECNSLSCLEIPKGPHLSRYSTKLCWSSSRTTPTMPQYFQIGQMSLVGAAAKSLVTSSRKIVVSVLWDEKDDLFTEIAARLDHYVLARNGKRCLGTVLEDPGCDRGNNALSPSPKMSMNEFSEPVNVLFYVADVIKLRILRWGDEPQVGPV